MVKRAYGLVGMIVFGAIWLTSGSSNGTDQPELPANLAKYRSWTQLLKGPYQVPMELWIRCMAPTPADWATARRKYGPHTERFIRVYGNPVASESVLAESKRPFPAGTVIAKEKLAGSPHGTVEGVAFMVKHQQSDFPDTSGWEFLYFPSSGDGRRTHEACASCHGAVASRDYVFGRYPR